MAGPGFMMKKFNPPKEFEGAWLKLHSTCRVVRAWVQITMPLLGPYSSLSMELLALPCVRPALQLRVTFFSDSYFDIASSYGQIPVIIGGDFQIKRCHMNRYKPLLQPLIDYDSDGNPCRPQTFRSSKDDVDAGLAVRWLHPELHGALCLGLHCNHGLSEQAPPPRAGDFQVGKVLRLEEKTSGNQRLLQRPAPDDPIPYVHTSRMPSGCGQTNMHPLTMGSSLLLDTFNNMAVDTLGGGHWPHGRPEVFTLRFKKSRFSKDSFSGATKDLRWLQKSLAMANEAIHRQNRPSTTSANARTTANSLYKFSQRIHAAPTAYASLRDSWQLGLVHDNFVIISDPCQYQACRGAQCD